MIDYNTMPLEELRALKLKHDDSYYGGEESEGDIPDAEYDLLKKVLIAREAPFDEAERTSSLVSTNRTSKGLVLHTTPMMSMKTATDYSVTSFIGFDSYIRNALGITESEFIEYVAELKYDGMSTNLKYEKGVLKDIVLRNDGYAGETVIQNVDRYDTAYLPRIIPTLYPDEPLFTGEIRGETMMTKETFEQINAALAAGGHKLKRNPRNAVAGAIRAKTSVVDMVGKLIFIPHGFGAHNTIVKGMLQAHQWLTLRSFKYIFDYVPKFFRYSPTQEGSESPFGFHQKAARALLGIEIDGVVYKVNDFELQKKLGNRSGEPRWAIAHKFPPKIAMTRVVAINAEIGRTGPLTPVAVVEPVELGGVTVTNVTLDNYFEIRRLRVKPGSLIELIRGGDVIPKIVRVVKEDKPFQPNIWPAKVCECGSPIVRPKGFVKYRCTNRLCEKQLVGTLKYFVSRTAMDIKGLGNETIEALFKENLISYPYDIYCLSFLEVAKITGDKIATGIMKSITDSHFVEDWRLLASVGIPNCGPAFTKLLCEKIDIRQLPVTNLKDLMELGKEIGEESAMNSLAEWFVQDPHPHLWTTAFTNLLTVFEHSMKISKASAPKVIKGQVVITGSFPIRREEIAVEASSKGWLLSNLVGRKTSVLLVGEKATAHKVEKAQSLGIPVVDYDKWKAEYIDKVAPGYEQT